MKPWRERVKASGLQPDPDTAAAWDRQDAAARRALQVFGNHADADAWILRAGDHYGGWKAPWLVAGESPEGLQRVLDHLAELAARVTPRPPSEHEAAERTRKGHVRAWKPRR